MNKSKYYAFLSLNISYLGTAYQYSQVVSSTYFSKDKISKNNSQLLKLKSVILVYWLYLYELYLHRPYYSRYQIIHKTKHYKHQIEQLQRSVIHLMPCYNYQHENCGFNYTYSSQHCCRKLVLSSGSRKELFLNKFRVLFYSIYSTV